MPDDNHIGGMRTGIPIDVHGGPTIDPTKNVLDLVQAAVLRQDDLRQAQTHRFEAEQAHLLALLESYDLRYGQRYEALEKTIDCLRAEIKNAFTAQKEAVLKAEASAEKRFEGVNEFRAQLGDQQRTLMPRVEAEKSLGTLADKIGVLEGFRTEMLSKVMGAKEGYSGAVGLVSLILAVLSLVSVAMMLLSRMNP